MTGMDWRYLSERPMSLAGTGRFVNNYFKRVISAKERQANVLHGTKILLKLPW